MIYANILTLVIVVKILVSLNFTFLGIYIVSYFIFHQKKKKRGWGGGSEYSLRKCALDSAGTGEPLKILKGKTELTRCEPSRAAQVGGPWLLTLFLLPWDWLPCATCRPRSQACRIKPLSPRDGRPLVMSRGTVNASAFLCPRRAPPNLIVGTKQPGSAPSMKTSGGGKDRWWSIH